MPDLTLQYLPRILDRRLEAFDLGPDAVLPAYDGLSILNVPSSLCAWLGVPPLGHPVVQMPELDEHARDAQQILLLLVDGLGWDAYRTWEVELPENLKPARDEVLLAPLTSIAPSTTSSALTTLWTGRAPAEHGFVGYELFLKEFGVVTNMITFSPMASNEKLDLLSSVGVEPEQMVSGARLGEYLGEAGVEVHAFLDQSLVQSPLSRMHFVGVSVHGYADLSDLWVRVAALMERPPGGRRLIWVYFSAVDNMAHQFGPASQEVHSAYKDIISSLENFLEQELPPAGREGSLLLLLADHGQIHTPKDPHYDLAMHPDLTRRLHMMPTGEHRLTYLYVRPGQTDAVRAYIERTWPETFRLMRSSHALNAGLLGPGTPDRRTLERMGDWVAAASGQAYLWWAASENMLLGRHGGFTRQEMLVPLLAVRLT
jgi:hypothetical protein